MKNDYRFALRMIASHPWFSAAIVLTLALGIGVNTTVFTLVNAVLFKPVPLPNGERLVVVSAQNLNETNSRSPISYPDWLDLKAQNRTLDALEAFSGFQATLSENDIPPAEYRGGRASWRLFEMVRTQPILGRGFTAADDKPGAPNIALIGYRVWQNRYGGARDVVGRVARINGQPTTIVGVMPDGFRFPAGHDVWIPLIPDEQWQQRSNRRVQAFALLRPAVKPTDAGADLAVVAKRLASAYPDSNKNIGATVQTFHEAFNGGNIRSVFLVMLGAVGFVLLIACANVANMMLSRALARRREISVRAAMGASRWQLVRQMLIESVLLSSLGGLIGLGLSLIGVRYFDQATLDVRPYWIQFNMDWVAFAYFAALSVGSGLLFGIVPAFRSSRVDLNLELKEGTRTAGNVRGGWLAGALVVFQFALTVVLLSGAGLMMRSFVETQSLNSFVPSEHIFTARVSLPAAKGQRYFERGDRVRFYEKVKQRMAALPGVTHAAVISNLPGTGSGTRVIEIEGKPADKADREVRAAMVVVVPGAFSAFNLPIRQGRDFNEQDGDAGREAAVATREFAARHWPNQPPIGKRFRFIEDKKPGPWIQIVGVSGDIEQRPMDNEVRPLVYVPHRQEAWGGMALLLRVGSGSPTVLANTVRTALLDLDQDLPLFDVMALTELLGRQRFFVRVFGSLFLLFAVIGLLIASMGIYAVVAQAAAMRTREIGIRMALGATARGILGIMLVRGVRQLAAGLVLGLAGAFAATQLMTSFLGRVSPHDPVVFTSVSVLLVTIGLFACWLPARRASTLHPVQALRDE